MRIYEEKMWLRSNPSALAWLFYIHDDMSIEYVKTPNLITTQDRLMIENVVGAMMNHMENANIADMQCKFVG